MVYQLSNLKNQSRPKKKVQRVGRGPGSNRGKTSNRGQKGSKARSGYKTRGLQEGGQLPLFRKMPTRGFTRGRHVRPSFSTNLSLLDSYFSDGDLVSPATLRQKGLTPRLLSGGVKILGGGELTKKITIEHCRLSKSAKEKLEVSKIAFKEA